MKKIWVIFFLFVFGKANATSVTSSLDNSSWQFRKSGDSRWFPATVPGTVHTDLLNNKIIDDPYYGDNEKKMQWIDTCNWEYQTFFDCDKNVLGNRHIELQFDGLDTYAKIFLNDSLILSADNMFRTWKVDCKKYLKEKGNHLLVQFESAVVKGKSLTKKLSYALPGDEKVFTRKAAYQYGWDWGPRFVTCGIWRNVELIGWNDATIESIQIIQNFLSDSVANITARIEVNADKTTVLNFFLQISSGKEMKVIKSQELSQEKNFVDIPFTISNPKRWWSNGLGEPYLYQYVFSIANGENRLDERKISFGLRTIELVRQKDSIGKSFYFKLNGIPVFMKGANYIPPDNFLPRVTIERYKEIIQSAVDANMNMLRVWGGGVYEDDKYYNLCDEKGILVWQDLMFACAMYPGDSLFIENVKQEVTDNVKRLRNHPCIALWCGNNEIDEGWKNWGWQQQYQYSEKDSAKIWGDYQKLFQVLIPSLLDTLLLSPIHRFTDSSEPGNQRMGESVNVTYISTSPLIGWGHKESLQQGDSHYWGVWWGMEPFDFYKKKVGRFMSEYGFQGMPSLTVFKKISDEYDWTFESPVVKNHQKHPTGYETIQKYLEKSYIQPIGFENYIYVSQLLQAEGIKTAIEAHRIAKPTCMGTLYWQLNDCWPVTSWSSTDYYGNWKALHYFVKKAYEKYLITAEIENENLIVNVASDDISNIKVKGKFQLIDFDGNVLWKNSVDIFLTYNKSEKIYSISLTKLLKTVSQSGVFFKMEIEKNKKQLAENIFYFVDPKELPLTKPNIQYTIKNEKNGTTSITLSSDKLAKNVFVDFGNTEAKLSDNYFDLIPGEQKVIEVKNLGDVHELEKKIKIKSLVDTY